MEEDSILARDVLFMRPSSELYSGTVSQLLKEQEESWREGTDIRIEDLLAKYPQQTADPIVKLNLLFVEVSLRLERGQKPSQEEYATRFPELKERLAQNWEQLVRVPAADDEATRSRDQQTLDFPKAPEPYRTPVVPGYVLRKRIGAGGMGVVYSAQQISLGRLVAIKFLASHRDGPWLKRFQAEGQIMARLNDPGIVLIIDSGIAEDRPYIVMEYLPFGSLSRRLVGGPLEPREAARIVQAIARAMQVVHDAGILHRDLKPGNILMTATGEPKVADFGLAKLYQEAKQSQSGAVLGTLQYMSPEQTQGKPGTVGPATDIWAVGAILYTCLTGKPPFDADSSWATVRLVCETEPEPLPATVPAELATICFKCLEKQPKDRFASATELADELGRWLAGQPIETKPRPKRTLTRRALLLASAATVAGVSAAAYGVGVQWANAVDPEIQLQKELAAGKGASLFHQKMPRSAKILVHEPSTQFTIDDDGYFAVTAISPTVIQFAADPGMEEYRLRMQIRHLRLAGATGSIGMFVGGKRIQTAVGDYHLRFQTDYDDIGCATQLWHEVREMIQDEIPGQPDPPLNDINNRMALQPMNATWKNDNQTIYTMNNRTEVFVSGAKEDGKWRKVALEVTRKGIQVVWENPAQPIPVYDPNKGIANLRRQIPLGHPATATMANQRFEPRGSLGVFLTRATAAFKNVVIEPL